MKIDKDEVLRLGCNPAGMARGFDLVRYVSGVVHRERERLARILPEHAAAILDESSDDLVFKFEGPDSPLDATPTSRKQKIENRKAADQSKE
jgi:hypothetical protein